MDPEFLQIDRNFLKYFIGSDITSYAVPWLFHFLVNIELLMDFLTGFLLCFFGLTAPESLSSTFSFSFLAGFSLWFFGSTAPEFSSSTISFSFLTDFSLCFFCFTAPESSSTDSYSFLTSFLICFFGLSPSSTNSFSFACFGSRLTVTFFFVSGFTLSESFFSTAAIVSLSSVVLALLTFLVVFLFLLGASATGLTWL